MSCSPLRRVPNTWSFIPRGRRWGKSVLAGAVLLLVACGQGRLADSAAPSGVKGRADTTPSGLVAPEPLPKRTSGDPASAVAAVPGEPERERRVEPTGSDAPGLAKTPPMKMVLQPLGPELPEADVEMVELALHRFYSVQIERAARIDLPSSAMNAARTRYRAEKLLDVLERRRPKDARFVLGITGVDISTSKPPYADWGILGLAAMDGNTCIISKFRTFRQTKGPDQARIRLAKTAVHEVGHNLGRPHCPTRGCLMEDAQGTVLTTDREYDLCPICREALGKGVLAEPPLRIPWDKPAVP